MNPGQRQILENFAIHLPPGGKILYAAGPKVGTDEEAGTPAWLRAHGFEIEEIPFSKDLRLLTLSREIYDGIWSGAALTSFPIEETQRILASFFQALKPRTGTLFAIHPYSEKAFGSLSRQSGYQILAQGRSSEVAPPAPQLTAVIMQRI